MSLDGAFTRCSVHQYGSITLIKTSSVGVSSQSTKYHPIADIIQLLLRFKEGNFDETTCPVKAGRLGRSGKMASLIHFLAQVQKRVREG
jgi:hypothetical protein